MRFAVKRELQSIACTGTTETAHEVRDLGRFDGARSIEDGDVGGAERVGDRARHLLKLVGNIETLHPAVEGDGGAPPCFGHTAAHRVLVVERPPIEKIDIVAAIHAHAGPEREIVLRSLGIELPHGELVVGDAEK